MPGKRTKNRRKIKKKMFAGITSILVLGMPLMP
jgi:hypothetical protein